jgi:hypothetical protein
MAYHHANRPDDVTTIVERLVAFEPKRARKLAQDTPARRPDETHSRPAFLIS